MYDSILNLFKIDVILYISNRREASKYIWTGKYENSKWEIHQYRKKYIYKIQLNKMPWRNIKFERDAFML